MEKIKRLIITREGIGFFKAILESYEEIGIMTVIDGKTGEIELIYPVSAEADLTAIMDPPDEGAGRDAASFHDVVPGAPGPQPIISEDVAMQAAEWKKHNDRDKRSLVEILKEEFGLSQDVLHYQVAQFYAFRVIDINERGARRLLASDALKILRGLPESIRQLAMRHKVLPYDLAENQPDKIIVVTPNPADREISDVARALPYKKFEICYMKERDWAEYWRQLTLEKDQPGSSTLTVTDSVVEEEESDFEGAIDRDISRGPPGPRREHFFRRRARRRHGHPRLGMCWYPEWPRFLCKLTVGSLYSRRFSRKLATAVSGIANGFAEGSGSNSASF